VVVDSTENASHADEEDRTSSELDVEVKHVRQHIDCALCGQPGTVAVCLECALRTCEICMNPNGK
jgi:hypothetical protein